MIELQVASDRGGAIQFSSHPQSCEWFFFPTTNGDRDITIQLMMVDEWSDYYAECYAKNVPPYKKMMGAICGDFNLHANDSTEEIKESFHGCYTLFDYGDPFKPKVFMVKE